MMTRRSGKGSRMLLARDATGGGKDRSGLRRRSAQQAHMTDAVRAVTGVRVLHHELPYINIDRRLRAIGGTAIPRSCRVGGAEEEQAPPVVNLELIVECVHTAGDRQEEIVDPVAIRCEAVGD